MIALTDAQSERPTETNNSTAPWPDWVPDFVNAVLGMSHGSARLEIVAGRVDRMVVENSIKIRKSAA